MMMNALFGVDFVSVGVQFLLLRVVRRWVEKKGLNLLGFEKRVNSAL